MSKKPSDVVVLWLRVLNYEMHLVQHGICAYMHARPWSGLLPGLAVLTVAWAVYWVAYPLLLGLWLAAAVTAPLWRLAK